MSGTPMPYVKIQFLDDDGDPAAGYQLFTYDAGTSNKANTYTDVALTTPNANPVVLDSAGRATIFLQAQSYKFILATPTAADPPAGGDQVWTADDIAAVPYYNVSSTITTAGTEAEWTASDTTLTLTVPPSPVIFSNYYVNNGTGTTAVDVPAGTLSNNGDTIICEWEVDYSSADLEARATAFGTNIDRGSGSDYTSDTVNSTMTRARIVFTRFGAADVYYSMTVLQDTSSSYEQVSMASGSITSLDLDNNDYSIILTMSSGTFTIRGARVRFVKYVDDLLG